MSVETITLQLPESLARELSAANQALLLNILERGLRELKIDQALEQYRQGGLSFGAAAQQAGVSQSELARQAYARGMEPSFSPESLAEELG
jgi:predicted HTH domain antitoxin